MINRRIVIAIASILILVLLFVSVNAIFTTRRVFAFSMNVALSEDERVAERNEQIQNSKELRRSSLFFNKQKATQSLEDKFIDIQIDSLEVAIPHTVRVNYFMLLKAFEAKIGNQFYQFSDSGRILSMSQESLWATMGERQLQAIALLSDNIDLPNAKVGDYTYSYEEISIITNIITVLKDFGFTLNDILQRMDSVSLKEITNEKVYFKFNAVTFIIEEYTKNFISKIKKCIEIYINNDASVDEEIVKITIASDEVAKPSADGMSDEEYSGDLDWRDELVV